LLPKEALTMKREKVLKKTFLALLSILLLAVNLLSLSGDGRAEGIAIEPAKVPLAPLAAENLVGAAQTVFNEGPNVETADLRSGSVTLNTNLVDKGIVGIRANIDGDEKLKVKVALKDQAVYYDIAEGETIKVPMQYGNGTYRVELYQNLSGNEYAGLYSENVAVALDDVNAPFLYPSQIVNYEDSQKSLPLAKQLVQGANSDIEILTALYGYVVQNISYDYDKIDNIEAGYIPDIDEVLDSKKGICYDYAAVLASLLREAGIPAKLVMGYRSDMQAYHAWNQVMVGGQWITVDATVGSVMLGGGQSGDMIEDASLYDAKKVF